MWTFQGEDDRLSQLSDGQLIQSILAGDEHAFEVLIRRYSSSLFQYITFRLGDYDMACDVLQQVFVQLYHSLPSLNQRHSLRPWLAQVARHKIIDEIRRKRWISFSELEKEEEEKILLIPTDSMLLPEEQLEYRELQSQMKKAIATLPERYQQVVTLRYLTQLPFSEISRLIGIPQATVKTQFRRAKPLLQAALQGEQSADRLPDR